MVCKTIIMPNRKLKNPSYRGDKYRKLLLKDKISFSEKDILGSDNRVKSTEFKFNPYKRRFI